MIPCMDAQKNRSPLLIFLGLSVLLHSFFVAGLYFSRWTPMPAEQKTVFIDLPQLPVRDLVAQQDQARQVVESEKAAETEKSKDAKYLGQYDQVVKEETKARQVDSFRQGSKSVGAGRSGQALSLKDLAPSKAISPPTKLEMEGYKREQKQMADAETGGGPAAADGSATNDYLKDVKEGDKTMLSTKEFVYFGYYQRIRKQLEVAWHARLQSVVQTSMRGGGRSIASNQDFITGVIVVLDRNGNITAVQLLKKSGAQDLDQAAVDAFNQAGPFPDPPKGLADENGEIRIPWNFILQS